MTTDGTKTNILIIANQWARMNDLLNFSEILSERSPNYRISFLLAGKTYIKRFPKCNNFNPIITKSKINLKNTNNKKTLLGKIKDRLVGEIRQLIMSKFPNSTLAQLLIYSHRKSIYISEYNHAHEIIDKKIDVILCLTDNEHKCCIPYLKCFKENNIPVITIILLNPAPSGMVMARINDPSLKQSFRSPLILHYLMWKYPKQVLVYENNKYLYHSPGAILALKELGLLTDYPFVPGTGFSDYVCADSLHDLNVRLSYNVRKEKLNLVGDYSYDALWTTFNNKTTIRKNIIAKYKLDKNKKIIIVALPQMAEHGYLSWEDHYSFINKILSTVCATEANVLLSLHPKMKLDNYKNLQSKYNCSIVSERLYEILPASDIYLSKPSSTIRWGVISDINVIMFDFWKFDSSSYGYLNSIDIAQDYKSLHEKIVLRLNTEQKRKSAFKNISRKELFDGKTIDRYMELIDQAVAKKLA